MCWNAEVSLRSFLIGSLAIGIAYQKGLSLSTTIFCLTIVFMQLIEYFVWTFYTNTDVNFVASLAAAFLLWLQPVASMLTLQPSLMVPALQLYGGLTFLGFFLLSENRDMRSTYRMSRADNGHLQWHWLDNSWKTNLSLLVYFVFLFVPLLFREQWEVLVLAVSTLGLSLYQFSNYNTWGSMWCWIVNYIVVGICMKQVLIAKP